MKTNVVELNIIKSRHDHRWTDDELKHLMAMWLKGYDLEAIARVFAISTYAVNRQVSRLRKNGVPLPRRSPGHRAGRFNMLWTPEEVEYVVRQRNEGDTYETIANALGRSYSAINGLITLLHKEGVPVKMVGKGKRKLWNADRLREAIVGRSLLVTTDEQ
jgi:biotin operon repressor